MSYEIYMHVLTKKVGSKDEKAILLRMAWAAHDDGTNCYISKERMRSETEIPKASFYEAVKKLEARGMIIRAGKLGVRINYILDLFEIAMLPDNSWQASRKEPKVPGGCTKTIKHATCSADSIVRLPDSNCPATGQLLSGSWTQHTEKKNNKTIGSENTGDTRLKAFAAKINQGVYVAPVAISTQDAARMLQLGLVTEQQLRDAGITH